MAEILDIDERSASAVMYADREVFTLIWSRPRSVLTFIKNVDYSKHFTLLVIMLGVQRMVSNDQMALAFTSMNPFASLALKIAIGAAVGWLIVYIGAGILSFVGGWFGGKATTSILFTCIVYASLPAIASLLVILPVRVAFAALQTTDAGLHGFDSNRMTMVSLMLGFQSLITLVAMIWSLVNTVIALSVAHEYSITKAIFTLLIPFSVAVVFAILSIVLSVS